MRLLVAGLSAREEVALGIFLDRNFQHWTWQSVAPDADTARPVADLMVLDMAAFSWAHWSETAEARLLAWLQDTPAVLLVSAHDRSWSAVQHRPANTSMAWLAKPYGTQAMRESLDLAAAAVRLSPVDRALGPAVSPVAAKPVIVRVRPTPAAAKVVLMAPRSVGAEPAKMASASEVPGLTIADFQLRLALQAESLPHVFLRVLSEMLSQTTACEARFTVQNSLIIHPSNGWVATNTPLQVIYRLCESDALAAAVTVRTLNNAQAEERAQRLGMPPHELEAFLRDLVAATLDKRAAATSGWQFSFT